MQKNDKFIDIRTTTNYAFGKKIRELNFIPDETLRSPCTKAVSYARVTMRGCPFIASGLVTQKYAIPDVY